MLSSGVVLVSLHARGVLVETPHESGLPDVQSQDVHGVVILLP